MTTPQFRAIRAADWSGEEAYLIVTQPGAKELRRVLAVAKAAMMVTIDFGAGRTTTFDATPTTPLYIYPSTEHRDAHEAQLRAAAEGVTHA